MWRIFQLNKHLSPSGHVWSKFGSGNRDSLSRIARELKKQGKLVHNTPISVATTPLPSRSGSPAPSVASLSSISSNSSERDADGGLVGRETRRRLVEWWSREYCASRMRLCIIGKGRGQFFVGQNDTHVLLESLDELTNLAVTMFSPILNRGKNPLPLIGSHPFGEEQKGVSRQLHS
jgi:insulysin